LERLITDLQKQAAGGPDVVPLCGGLPAPELLPRREAASALAEILGEDGALQYGWAEGDERIRAWVATRLAARGAMVAAEDVIVTAGAQQALSLAAAALLDDGDAIGVGAATYPAALDAFRQAGAIPTTAERGVAAHYVIPSVSNPTGVDGVAGRRHRLLASAVPLIVDEAYAELRFDGRLQPPLLAAARGRVWHVGTVSKTLSPGLRVGWLVAPRDRREEVLERKHAADLQAGSLAQATTAALLDELDYDTHVDRARRGYAARAAVLLAALRRHAPPSWRITTPQGGFSVWVEVDDADGVDEIALLDHAIRHGVSFDPGRLFRPDDAAAGLAFRLSFSSAPPGRLGEGVRRLVAAVASLRGTDKEHSHVSEVHPASLAVDR